MVSCRLLSLTLFFIALTGAAAADSTRTASTVAGKGTKGFDGDNAPAREAVLNEPSGLARGPDGALYFCDTGNHRIRRIAADGTLSTVAGTGEAGWSGDGGPAVAAQLNEPWELKFDAKGHLHWVERLSHTVRKLDLATGIVTTVAGTGRAGFAGDGGPAGKALLNQPHGLAFDRNGDLYICDIRNHRVRVIERHTGTINTFAGTGDRKPTPDGAVFPDVPLHGPRALEFDAEGNLWLVLRDAHAIVKLDTKAGLVRRVAGTGAQGFSGDGGPAANALLNGPKAIAIGPNGSIYVADTENHVIRRIDPAKGTIDVFAGSGSRGDGPDGPATACRLNRPHGLFVEPDGTVLIGDTGAHRIRAVK